MDGNNIPNQGSGTNNGSQPNSYQENNNSEHSINPGINDAYVTQTSGNNSAPLGRKINLGGIKSGLGSAGRGIGSGFKKGKTVAKSTWGALKRAPGHLKRNGPKDMFNMLWGNSIGLLGNTIAKILTFIFTILLIAVVIWGIVFGVKSLGIQIGGVFDRNNLDLTDVGTGIRDLVDDIQDSMDRSTDSQKAIAQEEYYDSTTDQYSQSNQGLFMRDLDSSETKYDYGDDATIYFTLDSKLPKNSNVNAIVQCYTEKNNKEYNRKYGLVVPGYDPIIKGARIENIVNNDYKDLRCIMNGFQFQEDRETVYTDLTFNFETRSYIIASFMNQDSLRVMKEELPQIYNTIKNYRTDAKNTDGPVQIGINSKDYPIGISKTGDYKLEFSLTKKWSEGKIKRFNNIEFKVPKGITILDCNTKGREEISSDETGTWYNISKDGLERINSQLDEDGSYYNENIMCNGIVDPNVLFKDINPINPKYATIQIITDYIYNIKEDTPILYKEGDFDLDIEDEFSNGEENKLTSDSIISCLGEYDDEEDTVDTESLSIKISKISRDELDASYINGNSETIKPDVFYSFNKDTSNENIGTCSGNYCGVQGLFLDKYDIKKNDIVICEMSFETLKANKELFSKKFIHVGNYIPQLIDVSVAKADDGKDYCYAIAADSDVDNTGTDVSTGYKLTAQYAFRDSIVGKVQEHVNKNPIFLDYKNNEKSNKFLLNLGIQPQEKFKYFAFQHPISESMGRPNCIVFINDGEDSSDVKSSGLIDFTMIDPINKDEIIAEEI